MNVILSIKPQFAHKILTGEKKAEFRKIVFRQQVDKVFIYSSAPVKKIVGFFTIKYIDHDSPRQLWEKYNPIGGIEKKHFFAYFGKTKKGYSIHINHVSTFICSINPFDVIDNFVPPQSFRYCPNDFPETGNMPIPDLFP